VSRTSKLTAKTRSIWDLDNFAEGELKKTHSTIGKRENGKINPLKKQPSGGGVLVNFGLRNPVKSINLPLGYSEKSFSSEHRIRPQKQIRTSIHLFTRPNLSRTTDKIRESALTKTTRNRIKHQQRGGG